MRAGRVAEPGRTMQEETPLAPAQIITSVILLPQYFLQLALDRMGRVACCSLSGVLGAARTEGMGSGPLIPPARPWGEEMRGCLSPALPLHGAHLPPSR